MKKVLFILGSFFPEPSANAICCMELIKKMSAAGHEVYCIAHRVGDMKHYEEIESVKVYRVYVALNNRWNRKYRQTTQGIYGWWHRAFGKILNAIYLFISMCYFPYSTPAFSHAVFKEARKTIKNHDIDTVICVNQPLTSLQVGCRLKEKYSHLKLIAYLLDPIRKGCSHRFLSEKSAEFRLQLLQNKVSEKFDLVIAQNEHRVLFDHLQNEKRNKVSYLGVPLLVERNVETVKLDETKKTVIYAGGLAETRSPKYIAEVFRHVKGATLHIFTSNHSTWVKGLLKDNPNVILHHVLNRNELLSIMKGADALLVIGNTQSEYAPSKLVECISFGKPVIATYRTDTDSCQKYMERYPLGLYLDERNLDFESAAEMIDAMLEEERTEMEFSEIRRTYWDNTPDAFLNITIGE